MRIFFIFLSLLYSNYLFSKEINLHYEIDWKSAHLADLYWDISINEDYYEIQFLIKSYGITDKIFNYISSTTVKGYIDQDQLLPISYKSKTKSSRQDVYVNMFFQNDGAINNLDISKELSDDQILLQNSLIDDFQSYKDSISQLTQYMLYGSDSDRMIIDGLNIYNLSKKDLSSIDFKSDKSDVYEGSVSRMSLIFPFFKGLHKKDKVNNLKEIHMLYTNIDNFFLPIQYDIFSKKFKAKLYLKNYKISNK